MSDTLTTTVILLISIITLVGLFVGAHRKRRRLAKVNQDIILADVVAKNKLQLDAKETINNRLFAIDYTNFILLYIDFSEPKEHVQIFEMWDIKSSKFVTDDNAIYEQRGGNNVLVDKKISQIKIELTTGGNNEKKHLVLYDYKDGMQDLVQVKRSAEKWSALINNQLKELPRRRMFDSNVAL